MRLTYKTPGYDEIVAKTIARLTDEGVSLKVAADGAGVSERTVQEWLRAHRAGELGTSRQEARSRAYTERVMRTISLVADEGLDVAAAAAREGIAPRTLQGWIRKYRPEQLILRRKRDRSLPRCDLCTIVLGRDELTDEVGNVIRAASDPTDKRCWQCREEYGLAPADELLQRED